MKRIQYIIFIVGLAISLIGCKEDPFEGIVSNERAIQSFKLAEGQIGVAEIQRDSDTSKVVVYVKSGTDLSSVTPDILTSYKATVEPASGEPVNFASNNNMMTYRVTAESGKTREWTVEVKEYEFDLGGSWAVADIWFWWWIGEGEDWGWQEERPLEWNIPNATHEKDNILTFELEGVTDDGSLYGTYTFDAGDDGQFADFLYTDGTDYNYKFRKLAPGSGNWQRNFENNTIIFNKGEDDESVSLTLEFSNDKSTLKLPFSTGPNDMDWGDDGNKQHLGAAKQFWYTLNKM